MFLIRKDADFSYVNGPESYVADGWEILGEGEEYRPPEGEWEFDGVDKLRSPLAVLKRRKRDEVNDVRQRYQDGGCVTPHGIADSDEKGKVNAGGCTQMADRALAKAARLGVPCEWSIVFTMHDSNPTPNVTLDAEQMGEVGEAVGTHIGKCHAVGVILKDMIEVADEAQLATIDVEAFFAGAFE